MGATGESVKPKARRRQLNPAFAAAHRINASSSDDSSVVVVAAGIDRTSGGPMTVRRAIQEARSTGRLNLSNCELNILPEEIWDLRNTDEVDLSMDRNRRSSNREQSFVEEEISSLDISDNEISSGSLDDRIERFKAVKRIRARRCNFHQIPWLSVRGLDCLATLDLAGNKIQMVPMGSLPLTLRELDLSSNDLAKIDTSIEEREDAVAVVLPNLIRLDVSNNQLKSLPSILEMPSLQTFRFGQNAITAIPKNYIFKASNSLALLEGAKNKLSDEGMPCLSECTQLRAVDLSNNLLKNAPRIHSSLVRLSIESNKLESISGLFSDAQCSQDTFRADLTELRLRMNNISMLDERVLKGLTKLHLLDARENDLKDLPRVLGYLPQLDRIPLQGNPFRSIRPSLIENTTALKEFLRKRGPPPPIGSNNHLAEEEVNDGDQTSILAESFIHGSHTLNLSNRKLHKIPKQLEQGAKAMNGNSVASQVKILNLSKNCLSELEVKWVNCFPQLSSIDATKNRLESLPCHIHFQDATLTKLCLGQNRLTSNSIAESALCKNIEGHSNLARSLVHLDLSSNALKWFPSALCDLPTLRTLILSSNQISTLAYRQSHEAENNIESGWRPGLPSLQELDLSSNFLSDLGDLPISLAGCCPMIRSLMLQNNEISSIPPQLGLLDKSLNHIDLRGNPQRAIRVGVLQRGCCDILRYLSGRMVETEMEDAKKKIAALSKSNNFQTKDGLQLSQGNNALDPAEGELATNENEETTAGISFAIKGLKQEIDQLSLELNNVHLSEACKYSMRKQIAMKKAALIREKRNLSKIENKR